MRQITHKILVLSGKGGVGKSMLSTQMAFSLSQRGFKVLSHFSNTLNSFPYCKQKQVGLLDIDICGPSVPIMAGIRSKALSKVIFYLNNQPMILPQGPDGIIPAPVNKNLVAVSIGLMVDDENRAVIWRGSKKVELIEVFHYILTSCS